MNWTPDRPTKPGNVPTNNLSWTKVTERLPPYQENIRVLIYTEGVEFNGVQFFDVPADSLYGDADDLEEAQRHATHWMLLTDLRLPYVEPPDPHVRYQQGEERDELLRKPRLSRAEKARLRELNDALSTETPEEQRYLGILRRAAKQRESLRSRIEALPDLVLGSGRVIGGAVDRGAVLALLETESQ